MAYSRFSHTVFTGVGLVLFLAMMGVAHGGGPGGWSPRNECYGYETLRPSGPECDFGVPVGEYDLLDFWVKGQTQQIVGSVPIRLLKTGEPVISATSDDSCFSGRGLESDCRKQFFVTGNKVAVRPIQVESGDFFCDKCFKLKLTNIQLPNGIFLNPKDNNPDYPESRRCVYFSTRCF
eukprot:TRINITY_DN1989_c0_g2_i1.p1 TRINITY_DN1989_c0_g2~~TRINITY_DN1989_c0_g2_i1.p1  ORF type:complete len:178 (-),score=13.95 TRINITY_DN1989_c0_g2_i1:583-1116(-)